MFFSLGFRSSALVLLMNQNPVQQRLVDSFDRVCFLYFCVSVLCVFLSVCVFCVCLCMLCVCVCVWVWGTRYSFWLFLCSLSSTNIPHINKTTKVNNPIAPNSERECPSAKKKQERKKGVSGKYRSILFTNLLYNVQKHKHICKHKIYKLIIAVK